MVSEQGLSSIPLKAVRRRRPVLQKKHAGLLVCLAVNSITMTKMHSSF